MAKKAQKKLNPLIKAELFGLAFLTVSILLFFGLGWLSRVISGVLIFFIGSAVYPLYIIVAIAAIVVMIGRDLAIISAFQKVGMGLLALSILIFITMLSDNTSSLFLEYVDDLVSNIKNYVATSDIVYMNGGVVGYTLLGIFEKLISTAGTTIVFSVLLIASIILIFQKPMRYYYNAGKTGVETVKQHKENIVKKEKPVKKEKKLVDNRQMIDKHQGKRKTLPIFEFADNAQEIEEEPEDEAISYDDVATEELIDDLSVEKVKVKNTGKYILPPLTLLADKPIGSNQESKQELNDKAQKLVKTLEEFNVSAAVVAVNVGPTVTQFELEIQAGTKLSKIKNLSGELSLALAAKDVRIQAPIPQKSTIGIEIPNNTASLVTLKEVIKAIPKSETNKTIFGLGKDIMGKPIYAALNKMPHMLVAGATGSGKSVCINSIIISIAMRAKPSEVKMLMIDPKKVELSGYNGLPHLMAPVVTNPKKASDALQKIVVEMERRYEIFSDTNSKNIESYNSKMLEKNLTESTIPYIVVIVDELADLMLVASKEVEDSIMRITQMARAAGIHLIVATQRPSTDIITGVIKSNIPSRIAFGVSSSIDSRTILDSMGAEKLLGKGDMLFIPMGTNHSIRIQGAFLSEEEVENVVHYCAKQQVAQFDEKILEIDSPPTPKNSEDDMYDEVLVFVLENGSASTSLLQRRFRIGYNRASRLIDDLEHNGVIGPANGSKPRNVISDEIIR